MCECRGAARRGRRPAAPGRSSPAAAWSCRRRCGRRCRRARRPPTPSETSVSSGRTPYALETRSRLTRLAIGSTTCAPATGPCATSTTRWSSAAVSAPGDRCAHGRPDSHRNTQVGPDPDTSPRRAPASTPSTISRARSGRRSQRGLLEVVVQRRGQPAYVAAGERGDDLVRRTRHQRRVRPQLVVVAVDRRRRHPLRRRHDDPPPGSRGRRAGSRSRRAPRPARSRRPARTARRCRAPPRAPAGRRRWCRGRAAGPAPAAPPRRRPTRRRARRRSGSSCPRARRAVTGRPWCSAERGGGPVDDVVAGLGQVARVDVRRDLGRHGQRRRPRVTVRSSYRLTAW